MAFVVHDIEDGSYLTRAYEGEREDEELWLPDRAEALVFATAGEAQSAIENCDEDEMLRKRLFVEPAVSP